jgi:S-DNA-T family DNA segregation ATPase FtsK/SpoIIIE
MEIVVEKGPSAGTKLPLTRGTMTVGADAGADLVLPGDEFVSSRHATIAVSNGHAILRNISSNGTLVNGRPVSEAPLEPGDRISIGLLHLLSVKAVARPVAAPPPRRAAAAPAPVSAGAVRQAATAAPTAAAATGKPAGFRMPVWLMGYLILMGLVFVFFTVRSVWSEGAPDLKQIQAEEKAYSAAHKLPEAETSRVLKLLETATVRERRGDARSAYEAHREVLAARRPIDPNSPAYRYAAARVAALRVK